MFSEYCIQLSVDCVDMHLSPAGTRAGEGAGGTVGGYASSSLVTGTASAGTHSPLPHFPTAAASAAAATASTPKGILPRPLADPADHGARGSSSPPSSVLSHSPALPLSPTSPLATDAAAAAAAAATVSLAATAAAGPAGALPPLTRMAGPDGNAVTTDGDAASMGLPAPEDGWRYVLRLQDAELAASLALR